MPACGYNIQQWRKFVCSSFNKTSLVKLLVGEWKLQINAARHGILCDMRRNLFQDDSRLMGGSGGAAVNTRRSRHSFAFVCTACCKNLLKAVIVTSEDTDVMLFCLAFQKDIPCPIYQKCGTQNSTRLVEISKLAW